MMTFSIIYNCIGIIISVRNWSKVCYKYQIHKGHFIVDLLILTIIIFKDRLFNGMGLYRRLGADNWH